MKSFELLSEIALTFVTSDNFDFQMQSILNKIGNYTQVSRVYIFINSTDGTTTSNTYEWCNEGISPQIDDLQNLPFEIIPSWKEILLREGRVYSENILELPADLVAILEPQQILSILVYPLYIEHKFAGFVGFDECKNSRRWSGSDLNLLKTISGIISNVYERHTVQAQLTATKYNFETFFNTVDDLMIIGSTQGRVLYVNNAVKLKLGYSLEELRTMTILELHPEDKREEASAIIKSMFSGELDYCPLEVMSKDGKRIPVETRVWFGKWDGQECIFGISKDLSKEQESLQKFTKLFENNPAPMAINSIPESIFTEVNSAFIKKLGYKREEILGKTSHELNLFIDQEKQLQIAKELTLSGRIKDIELRVRCKDGTILYGLFSGEIIENQGKMFFLTVMIDITEQVLLPKKIEEQKHRLENIIDGTHLGTWEWNIQTGETVFNERWAGIIGYTLDELAPVSIETWIKYAHPDDLKESDELLKKHFNNESDYYDFESRMLHKNGSWVWVLDRGKVIERDSDGKPLRMFGTHADITEKKQLQEKIKEISIRDPLTNIFNRRYIFERLEIALSEFIRKNRIFTVSIIDIDHFKNINDSFGHQAGDQILIEFSEVLSSNLRPYDLLGRYGGEEFIVVSMNANKEQSGSAIERILSVVRNKTFIFNNNEIKLTFSCGISESVGHNNISVENIIGKADERLYEAKNTGRNKIVISDKPAV